MKKTSFFTLMAAVLLLTACKPTEDPLNHLTDKVTVITQAPDFISGTTAVFGAEVTADNAGLLLELGVCWNRTGNPTIDETCAKTHKCSQPYTVFVGDLEPNTKYFVRGFAKYGTEYVYGDEKTFSTLGTDAPTASPVTTLEATEITYQGFCADAALKPFGISNYIVGICYSTSPNFTLDDCEGYNIGDYDSDNDVYHVCNPWLSPNTQYYYRAFVNFVHGENNQGFYYGDILSLTTPEMPFILNLETYDVIYSWYDYMVAYGRVECNQPEQINQVGFCYSTDNAYPQYDSDLHTTAATPTGEWYEFSSHIYDVSANKKYYVRSYARYMTDSIKYGNVVTVDTY